MLDVRKKRLGIVIALVISVMVGCLMIATELPFWADDISGRASTMGVADVTLTIVDEQTIILENMIKGSDISYSWDVVTYINDKKSTNMDMIESETFESITFEVEDLERLEFQAILVYDGYMYTSNTYYVSNEGTLYMDSEQDISSIESVEVVTREIGDIVSIAYLCFLTIMVLLYYIVPKKMQWGVLLVASIIFYLVSGVQYIIFIVSSAFAAFIIANKMSKKIQQCNQLIVAEMSLGEKKKIKSGIQKENKSLLYMALIVILGTMIVIKYSDFVFSNINALVNVNIELLNLVMPLGLSFYTFMLVAYLVDVYRGKYEAEKRFSRFFLFVSFFPHVSQGPLSRYNEIAPQLRGYQKFDFGNFCMASQRILWGFFIKLVLADRIAILVNGVYDEYSTQSWLMLLVASLAYSIQVYADFYSCMEIAIGSAQMFGVTLQENFLRPYFATTMPEFWRRWHATLGAWFKDYVFYPLSISKNIMKFSVKARKRFGPNLARVMAAVPPIMGVWILTGLWHGASWNFVAWGLFHGMLILLSTAFSQPYEKLLSKIGIKTQAKDYKLLQMVKVFLICTTGRIFFRAPSISAALEIFVKIITLSNVSNDMINCSTFGLEIIDYAILIFAIILLLIVSIIQEKIGSVRNEINNANIWIRWPIWIGLFFMVLIFGVYGPNTVSAFIYEAF